MHYLTLISCLLTTSFVSSQIVRTLGPFQEVFAWKQVTFNIGGTTLQQDRLDPIEEQNSNSGRRKRQNEFVFDGNNDENVRNWNTQTSRTTTRRPSSSMFGGGNDNNFNSNQGNNNGWNSGDQTSRTTTRRPSSSIFGGGDNNNFNSNQGSNNGWNSGDQSSRRTTTRRPSTTTRRAQNNQNNGNRPTTTSSTTTSRPSTDNSQDNPNAFFIQYNNLPMGVERVGRRVFITLPRRRYGIPSTLNYLSLDEDTNARSPPLRPYPSLTASRSLTSVYRTRADQCGRLWMVDTGLLEIPNNRQQVQPPAIVVYDLNTDRQILRYNFKDTDLPSAVTPTGLASITIDIQDNDCNNAYAYIPDLATYGLIVYSMRENDSWRLSHNYFSFNPLAGNMVIAGQRFQWSDGVFSITLSNTTASGCRNAYFHAMVGTHEFSVSTCTLRNRTASQDSNFWSLFTVTGNRGANSQSTMHGYHAGSNVIFFADIARSAISCWNAGNPLTSANVGILASDSSRLNYPSDLHVIDDEVWVMANSLPTWAYSRLDTNEYNFFVYRGDVRDLIRNTVCEQRTNFLISRSGQNDEEEET